MMGLSLKRVRRSLFFERSVGKAQARATRVGLHGNPTDRRVTFGLMGRAVCAGARMPGAAHARIAAGVAPAVQIA